MPGYILAVAYIFWLVACGMAHAEPDATPPALVGNSALRALKDGDRLRITIPGLFDTEKSTSFYREVDRQGEIFLPYAGRIGIGDMTLRLAARKIASVYHDRQGLSHSEIKVELITPRVVPPLDDIIYCGDWLRFRIWQNVPPHETRYILRVGVDGRIRFPGVGLLYTAHSPLPSAEESLTKDLKKRGLFTHAEIVLEPLSDVEARTADASERIASLPPATQPAKAGKTEPRNLSADPQVKFVALPWTREMRGEESMHINSPILNRFSATGRVEAILAKGAHMPPTRVIWETTLPDGFYEFEASDITEAGVFRKLVTAYEHAFDCTITRERREIPVLVLTADKPLAEKSLHEAPAIVETMTAGGVDSKRDFLQCSGKLHYFAENLEAKLDRPIIDETDLTRHYELKVTYARNDPAKSIDASLRPQGMMLTEARRTLDVVVVKNRAKAAPIAATKPAEPRKSKAE